MSDAPSPCLYCGHPNVLSLSDLERVQELAAIYGILCEVHPTPDTWVVWDGRLAHPGFHHPNLILRGWREDKPPVTSSDKCRLVTLRRVTT